VTIAIKQRYKNRGIVMIVSLPISGKSTEAVKIIDSITKTAITPPVKKFSRGALTQGPSTALSLHSGAGQHRIKRLRLRRCQDVLHVRAR
jgi:hypothetical protein